MGPRALGLVKASLGHIFNMCLRQRAFPPEWKKASLVLLPKEGKEAGTPSAYRPICLLDEVGKIFERIIANRLVRHLSQGECNLHEEQYGFREGRSTISRVISLSTISRVKFQRKIGMYVGGGRTCLYAHLINERQNPSVATALTHIL